MREQNNQTAQATRCPPRTGFSLIEAIVVVGVIGLLASLLLPAVQTAREAARTAHCKGNLRQLVQGLHGYSDVHGCLPMQAYHNTDWLISPGILINEASHHPSWHAQILPYIGEQHIYEELNLSCWIPAADSLDAYSIAPHQTVMSTRISLFLCPSDPTATAHPAANSYRGTISSGPYYKESAEFPDGGNGVFGNQFFPNKWSFISDGLSKTACVSERIIAPPNPNYDHLAVIKEIGPMGKTAPQAIGLCTSVAVRSDVAVYEFAGKYWFFTGTLQTYYNHVFPPNSRIVDCAAMPYTSPPGAVSARSYHETCVLVARCDTSVTVVSKDVSLEVWRAFATASGGEIAD